MPSSYANNKRWRKKNPGKANAYIKNKKEKRNKYRKDNYAKTECNNKNKGSIWTTEHDELIMLPKSIKPPDREISAQIGKSVKIIHDRRYKINKQRKKEAAART